MQFNGGLLAGCNEKSNSNLVAVFNRVRVKMRTYKIGYTHDAFDGNSYVRINAKDMIDALCKFRLIIPKGVEFYCKTVVRTSTCI